MKKQVIIFSSLILLSLIFFFIKAYIIYNYPDLSIDKNITNTMYDIRGEKYKFIYWFFVIITEFGHIYFVVLFLILWAIYTKLDYRFFVLALMIILSICFNQIAKDIINRERPDESLRWAKELDESFPSGHSTLTGVIYPSLIYFVLTSNKDKLFKTGYSLIFAIIASLVLLSRLILGVHYFTDVLVGFIDGFMFTCFGILICIYFKKHNILQNSILLYFKKDKNEVKESDENNEEN